MLTPRQSQLLSFIVTYQREHGGTSPSIREMKAHLGTRSVSTAYSLLDYLEARRFIRRVVGSTRNIQVLHTEIATEREEELARALRDAILQIEYLHEKFGETGSGNGVLAQVRDVLGERA